MDLVSFETPQEYDWVKGFMDGEDCDNVCFDVLTIGVRTCHNNQGEKYPIVVCKHKTIIRHQAVITYHTHYLQPMCLISGPPAVSATLTGVIDLTSSPRTSTAGSGQPTR